MGDFLCVTTCHVLKRYCRAVENREQAERTLKSEIDEYGNSFLETSSNTGYIIVDTYADTPQFLGGNPYFFCENLYQSVSFVDASMYHAIFHAIRVAIQFAKNRDIA